MKIYHDADEDDSWTEITGIRVFPEINHTLNTVTAISFEVQDKEGSLYSTWKDYDRVPIKVEDNNSHVLFRGFLVKKFFRFDRLVCICSGIGLLMQWTPFTKNYVYHEGLIKDVTPGGDSDRLDLEQLDDAGDFSWEDDNQIGRGILIVDNTHGESTKEWVPTAIDISNADSEDETLANAEAKDGDMVYGQDYEKTTGDVQMDFTIGGTVIPAGSYIKRIRLHYNGFLRISSTFNPLSVSGKIYFQIDYNGYYQTFKVIEKSHWSCDFYTPKYHYFGFGDDEWDFKLENTHAILQYFFNKDGSDNYEALKGIRIIMELTADDADAVMRLSFDKFTASIDYHSDDISPIMTEITDSGASWTDSTGTDWDTEGVTIGDTFKIGEATSKVINELSYEMGKDIEIVGSTTKFVARDFRGLYIDDILNMLCQLENAFWYEDFINNKIKFVKNGSFEDSGYTFDTEDYHDNWDIEDQANQYKEVHVYGNAAYEIFYLARDSDTANTSKRIKTIFDDTIIDMATAKEVGEEMLDFLKTKRLSIQTTIEDVKEAATPGTYANLTMAYPTIAAADYDIRKVKRVNTVAGIRTTIYFGLGETRWDESLASKIRKAAVLAYRAMTNKYVSTSSSAPGGVNWADVYGRVAGVQSVINDELVDGESIDAAIDTLIATHVAISDAHHAKYTDNEARAAVVSDAIYGAAWNGQTTYAPSLNTTYDKINAHEGNASAHHAKYLDAEAVSAMGEKGDANPLNHDRYTDAEVNAKITTACGAGQVIDNTIDALIAAHHDAASADHDDRYYTEAETYTKAEVDDAIDLDIVTHTNDDDAHHARPVYSVDTLQLIDAQGDIVNGYYRLDASGEKMFVSFLVHDMVDDGEDLTFEFSHNCTSADASVSFLLYAGAVATDGTEAMSWNIWNGAASSIVSTNVNKEYTKSITIDAADYSADDRVMIQLRLNEANRTVYFATVKVKYTLA